MKSYPVRTNNAIDHISFILTFAKDFDESTVEKLLGMSGGIGKLTEYETVYSIAMVMDRNLPRQPTSKPLGITLIKRSLDPEETEGKPEWLLRAASNSINVTCSLYTNWAEIFDIASGYIFQTLENVDTQQNPVVEFAIHTEDIFKLDDLVEYDLGDVFNLDSDYLTKKVTNNNLLWHVHQGWFDEIQNLTILNNLNISTNFDQGQPHVTEIGHLTSATTDNGKPRHGISNTEAIHKFVNSAALCCHGINKSVIQNLLNDESKRSIGL
jgi:hypothetical protein